MSGTVKAPVYLQIAREHRYPYEAKVMGATQRKPRVRIPDTILVKITIEIPRVAFDPIEPVAVVSVPESMIQRPISVQAEPADG